MNGEMQTQRVDTGRREKGRWISQIKYSEVEKKTLLAPSGVCFRQLGSTSGLISNPKQICLDLAKFQVNDLLRCEEMATYHPSDSTVVQVNLGDASSPPPTRVLGHEMRERVLPMGQEVYAMGDVVWSYRASVKDMQGEGALAVLQPSEAGCSTLPACQSFDCNATV